MTLTRKRLQEINHKITLLSDVNRDLEEQKKVNSLEIFELIAERNILLEKEG